jgi:hypothetical protein
MRSYNSSPSQITNLRKPIWLRYRRKKPAGREPPGGSPLFVRMHPEIRRDLARFGQLDHVHWRRVAAFAARSAFQRGFKLPDRRVPWPADVGERETGAGLTAIALDLEPTKPPVEALPDGRRRLRRSPSIRIDQISASARSGSRRSTASHFRGVIIPSSPGRSKVC